MFYVSEECHKCFRPAPHAMFTFPLTSDAGSLLAPVLLPWTPSQDFPNIPRAEQVRKIKNTK